MQIFCLVSGLSWCSRGRSSLTWMWCTQKCCELKTTMHKLKNKSTKLSLRMHINFGTIILSWWIVGLFVSHVFVQILFSVAVPFSSGRLRCYKHSNAIRTQCTSGRVKATQPSSGEMAVTVYGRNMNAISMKFTVLRILRALSPKHLYNSVFANGMQTKTLAEVSHSNRPVHKILPKIVRKWQHSKVIFHCT